MNRLPALVAPCMLVLAFGAQAAPVTYAFTGALNQIPTLDPASPFPDPVGETTPFSGTLRFDTATPDSAADPQSGAYAHSGAPYGFTLAIGGLTLGYDAITLTVLNDFGGLGDQLGFVFAEPSGCGKDSCAFFSLSLVDPTSSVFASDAMPVPLPALAAFLFSDLFYSDTIDGNQVELKGALDSLACIAGCSVREPGAPALLLAAALAAASARRRHPTLSRRS